LARAHEKQLERVNKIYEELLCRVEEAVKPKDAENGAHAAEIG
jgi:hypothetical protein